MQTYEPSTDCIMPSNSFLLPKTRVCDKWRKKQTVISAGIFRRIWREGDKICFVHFVAQICNFGAPLKSVIFAGENVVGGRGETNSCTKSASFVPFLLFLPGGCFGEKVRNGKPGKPPSISQKTLVIYINQHVILCWSWFNTFKSIEKRYGRDNSGLDEQLCFLFWKIFFSTIWLQK